MERMEKVVLNASHRTVTGKKVGILRRSGKLPAVVYGHNVTPMPIEMDLREATRTLQGVSASTLVELNIEGDTYSALVRETQRDFIKGTYLHVDFQAVSTTEKLRTGVGIEFLGESPAVRELNGFIVTGLDSLEVECFPQHLPEKIEVDISGLAAIGDGIYVRDIPITENVSILDDPEEMIALVTLAGKEEEAEEEVEEGEELEEPEVIERARKDVGEEEEE